MSASRWKWAYNPIKCDDDYCPGDCDGCQKANVPVDATVTIEELIGTFNEWKRRSVEFLDRRLMDTTETIIVYDATIKALESQVAMRNAAKEELDKIRTEIASIDIHGQVDEHTMFIRSGEQVKQAALDIIDRYNLESEG